ncbi:sulfotransferase [Lacinutrix iliipiscaria]|uniref:Sulfotransferase n=1 Tax=Lacinutrix iliipiscaria TaxID=1230532 RepID=A0ABW5WM92_9FLAO
MKKFKKHILHFFLKLKVFRTKDSILIFSEARGGSTWLMELLKNIPGVIINWEPLHVDYGVVPKSYKLGWRPKIDKENKETKYKTLFSNIIRMKTFNDWTTKYVSWKDVQSSKYVLTKFVRGNQCLPWFVNTFSELKHPPILLLRHPITTCISRLKTFEGVTNVNVALLENDMSFKIPDCINNERFVNHQKYIHELQTQLEVEIAIWCVNNADIIKLENQNKWMTLFYEDLVSNPKQTLKEVLKGIHIELSDAVVNQIQYTKPSASNYHGNFKPSKVKQIESYLDHLNQDTLLRIQSIFDYFNLKVYSAFSAYPIK